MACGFPRSRSTAFEGVYGHFILDINRALSVKDAAHYGVICTLQEGSEQAPMNEDELINLIDGVLRDDDKNNDGYIDYAEFAKSLQ